MSAHSLQRAVLRLCSLHSPPPPLLNSPVELLSSCKMQNAKILAIKKKKHKPWKGEGKMGNGKPRWQVHTMTAMLPWALQQLAKHPLPCPSCTHPCPWRPQARTHTHTRMRIRVWLRPRQIANIFVPHFLPTIVSHFSTICFGFPYKFPQ